MRDTVSSPFKGAEDSFPKEVDNHRIMEEGAHLCGLWVCEALAQVVLPEIGLFDPVLGSQAPMQGVSVPRQAGFLDFLGSLSFPICRHVSEQLEEDRQVVIR